MATKKTAGKKPAKKPAPRAAKAAARPKAKPVPLVTVHLMGKACRVPADATIMGAIEYAGYQIKRGAGCREGYCGACATVYRLPNDYKIYTGLACTTIVKEGMWLAQFPASPAHKPVYRLEELTPTVATIQKLYPEVFRCLACNTCSKACPQDLPVMDYIQAAKRGDIAGLMDLSFDCVMCGLCAIRCPAEIVQFNVGLLGKRLFGRYLSGKSTALAERVAAVRRGAYDKEYRKLMRADKATLSKLYYDRDMED